VFVIVHSKGNVLAGLADGTVAFFRRHESTYFFNLIVLVVKKLSWQHLQTLILVTH